MNTLLEALRELHLNEAEVEEKHICEKCGKEVCECDKLQEEDTSEIEDDASEKPAEEDSAEETADQPTNVAKKKIDWDELFSLDWTFDKYDGDLQLYFDYCVDTAEDFNDSAEEEKLAYCMSFEIAAHAAFDAYSYDKGGHDDPGGSDFEYKNFLRSDSDEDVKITVNTKLGYVSRDGSNKEEVDELNKAAADFMAGYEIPSSKGDKEYWRKFIWALFDEILDHHGDDFTDYYDNYREDERAEYEADHYYDGYDDYLDAKLSSMDL